MPRGRKAKTWIDICQATETHYVENTVGAIGKVRLCLPTNTEKPFIRAVEKLINYQIYSPPETSVEEVTQKRLRYVVCNFLCRKFNIQPPWPLVNERNKPLCNRTLKYIDVLGAEATSLFNLVSDVWAVLQVEGYDSAAAMWAAIMLEGVSGVALPEHLSDRHNKKEALHEYQGQTKMLQSREINPFNGGAHRAFFDVAIPLANSIGGTNDKRSIYARSYKPYLEDRSTLAAYLLEGKSRTVSLHK